MEELFELRARVERLERQMRTMQREIDGVDHCRGCPVRDEFDQLTTKETLQPAVHVSQKRNLTAQEAWVIVIVCISSALIVFGLHVAVF